MASFKAVVFDLDGVVYRGSAAIPGVPGEICRLQKLVKVLFLTNNATKSRKDYVQHLAHFGINAQESEIMTSSFGCAHYIREKYGKGKRVFVVGEQGLKDELVREADAKLVEGGDAEFVVAGLDRQINYQKLDFAVRNLMDGAHFILSNSDPTFPTENGFSPGSGSIGSALMYAASRKPEVIIGKPSTYLLDKLLGVHNIPHSDAAFVGDRLQIDIRMANSAGLKSVLVLTGVAKRGDAENAPECDKPQLIIDSAKDVGKALMG